MEIDVDKPLVSEIWVRNSIQTVEYEGLHVVCFGCGVVGHREQACPVNNPKAPETSDMDLNEANGPNAEPQQTATTPSSSEGTTQRSRKYGTWMLVTIKPKKVDQTNYNHQKKFYANVHKFALPTRGNQFEALGILKTRMCLLQPHRGRTNQLRSPARDPKVSLPLLLGTCRATRRLLRLPLRVAARVDVTLLPRPCAVRVVKIRPQGVKGEALVGVALMVLLMALTSWLRVRNLNALEFFSLVVPPVRLLRMTRCPRTSRVRAHLHVSRPGRAVAKPPLRL